MAFFKFRKGGEEPAAPATQPESVDVLRRRAKNRLIGAAILVLAGVIGFPLLVDKQPRPVTIDLPIEIPDKNKVMPLAVPAAPAASESAAVEPAESAVAPAPVPAPAPKVTPKPESKPVEPKAAPAKPEPARAEPKAGKAESRATKPASDARFVVQVGSFAEEARARDVRHKLERAGLKNYTQTVDTKDGRRIRVRAGPFGTRAEAERVAEKLKKMDLPGTVLSL